MRSNAPSSPGFLHRSAALRIRRFSTLEYCRRLAVAATSGSGATVAADPAVKSPDGLPAPQDPPLNRLDLATIIRPSNGSWGTCLCSLNSTREVSHIILARGGVPTGFWMPGVEASRDEVRMAFRVIRMMA